jgi:hypothetical protein
MANFPGNAIPAPAYLTGSQFVDDELMYSMEGYTQKGVTLEPGQGVLLLGTILARKTSTKRYVKYASGGADGAGTALGILRQSTDTGLVTVAQDPNVQKWQANIVIMGLLKLDRVVAANSGVNPESVLGARANAVEGFFKF